jgi:hypothetical protein
LIKGKVSEDLKRRIIKTLVYGAHLMWVISHVAFGRCLLLTVFRWVSLQV